MALINCGECGEQVSSKAESCPKCGVRITPKPRGCASTVGLGLLLFFIVSTVLGNFLFDKYPAPSTGSTLAPFATVKQTNAEAELQERTREARRAQQASDKAEYVALRKARAAEFDSVMAAAGLQYLHSGIAFSMDPFPRLVFYVKDSWHQLSRDNQEAFVSHCVSIWTEMATLQGVKEDTSSYVIEVRHAASTRVLAKRVGDGRLKMAED